MQPFAAISTKNGAKLLVWFKKYAIELFQYSSIVFDLPNMEHVTDYLRLYMLFMTQQLANNFVH